MIAAPHRPGGFSLIELLVSMAIGATILLGAAAMLERSGRGYERIGGGVAAEREARALITRLTADLTTARFHQEMVLEKSTAAVWPASRLGCLCLQPARAQSDAGRLGDLCAVNYYLKDLPIGGKTVRCLMRGCRESLETFRAIEENRASSLFTKDHPGDEPVAFGVVSFELAPKSRDQAGRWLDWRQDGRTGPEAVAVSLVIARRGLAAKLKQAADWDGAGASGWLLGSPAGLRRHPELEVYATLISFGNHENPQYPEP